MRAKSNRPKQKVVEVLSLYSLLRGPNPNRRDNPWIAEVRVEVRSVLDGRLLKTIRRTVIIQAKDELAAYVTLVTEGV